MLSTLAQCEFSLGKTLMVYDMNLREMENYEKIYTNIGRKRPFIITVENKSSRLFNSCDLYEFRSR